MELIRFTDVKQFSAEVMDFLKEYEVENNLMIGNILRGIQFGKTEGWFMASVRNHGKLVSAAMLTPPFNFLVYEESEDKSFPAMPFVIEGALGQGLEINGVVAEKSMAAAFAKVYGKVKAIEEKPGMKMRIYKLEGVEDLPQASGRLREATEADLFFLPYWQQAFAMDCEMMTGSLSEAAEKIRNQIEEGVLFIWDDKFPVAQTAAGRKTLNGVVINAVYTPPYFRKKGYGTSCVAEVSRIMLKRGNKFCALFTDLANPISNSIYMKIGYKPICDFDEIYFTKKPCKC